MRLYFGDKSKTRLLQLSLFYWYPLADDQPDGLKLKFLSEPITLDEDNGVQHVVVEVTVPKESIQPFNITAKSGDGTTGSKAIGTTPGFG